MPKWALKWKKIQTLFFMPPLYNGCNRIILPRRFGKLSVVDLGSGTVTPQQRLRTPSVLPVPVAETWDIRLTHWDRVTHTTIGSDNGLSPAWTVPSHHLASAGIVLIGPPGTNFCEILVGMISPRRLILSGMRWTAITLSSYSQDSPIGSANVHIAWKFEIWQKCCALD